MVIGWEALWFILSQSEGFQATCRFRLTAPRLLLRGIGELNLWKGADSSALAKVETRLLSCGV